MTSSVERLRLALDEAARKRRAVVSDDDYRGGIIRADVVEEALTALQASPTDDVMKWARDLASKLVRCGAPGIGNGNKVAADEIKGGLHDDYFIVKEIAAALSSTGEAKSQPLLGDGVERLVNGAQAVLDWMDGEFSDTDFDMNAMMAEAHAKLSNAMFDYRRAALATPPSEEWKLFLHLLLRGCEAVESGPNGRGGMKVSAHFAKPGEEIALFNTLSEALSALLVSGGK